MLLPFHNTQPHLVCFSKPFNSKDFAKCAFHFSAPAVWNLLPNSIIRNDSTSMSNTCSAKHQASMHNSPATQASKVTILWLYNVHLHRLHYYYYYNHFKFHYQPLAMQCHLIHFLAHNVFISMYHRTIAMTFICLSLV